MITYTEKGINLHNLINESGYTLSQIDGVWVSSDDIAVQAIIDSYDPLPEAKEEARLRVKIVASEKVAAIYPFIDPTTDAVIGLYQYTLDMYQLIIPAARESLTGRLLEFKNIRDAALSAIGDVNAMTDWQLVNAYDAVNTPAWPN